MAWLETIGLLLPFLYMLASWVVGGLKVARDGHGVFSWYELVRILGRRPRKHGPERANTPTRGQAMMSPYVYRATALGVCVVGWLAVAAARADTGVDTASTGPGPAPGGLLDQALFGGTLPASVFALLVWRRMDRLEDLLKSRPCITHEGACGDCEHAPAQQRRRKSHE